MKVILTAEVKGKGHEGDVVDVARGYAVNYLLPRKMAIAATPGNIKQLEARMSNISKRNDARRTDAQGIADAINGKSVVIEGKAGEEGKLFGSVTTLMIEEALASQLGIDVDHKRMDLHRPIKTTGEHMVGVSVFGDVKAEIVVRVVPEGGAAAAKAAEAEVPVEAVVEETVEVTAEEAPADEAAMSVEEPDASETESAE
jgi:large subunit ribosomal protein L9